MALDDTDRTMLRHLQQDARITNKELAQRVNLSAPGLMKRLRRLEDDGVVQRYATLVDREAIGFDLLCFVQVTLAHHEPKAVTYFRQCVCEMPEVLECHHLTGEYDYLLKVLVRNRKELERFLVDRLTPLAGMDRIRTSVVLREIKATTAVPLDEYEGDGEHEHDQ